MYLREDKPGDKYVDDGSLVSFVSNLKATQKQDVLDSTLLAQLAANKHAVRFEDTEGWYKFYVNVMENVGWVIQSFNFNDYKTSQASFTLSQVMLEILSAMVGGEKAIMDVVKATLKGLEKSTEGAKLFEITSVSGKNGNFQIIPCQVDKSGQVNVAFIGFFFEAQRFEGDFFFFDWKSQDIKLFYAKQACTLNEAAYASVRQAVIEKLGDRRKKFIADLDI